MTKCGTCKEPSKVEKDDYNDVAGWHYQDGLGWYVGQVDYKRIKKEMANAGKAYKKMHPDKAKRWDSFEKNFMHYAKDNAEAATLGDEFNEDIARMLNESAEPLDKEFEKLDMVDEEDPKKKKFNMADFVGKGD